MRSLLSSLILIFPLWALGQFQVPALSGPVVDQAGIINPQDAQALEALIRHFHQLDKGQIQILTVRTLGGLPIEQASIQVTDQWKLGNAKKDDGTLIMVAAEERRIRIEVGQGLEGVLTDLQSKRIIEDVMIPIFRQDSPSKGILYGAFQVMKTIDPEFNPEGMQMPQRRQQRSQSVFDKFEGIFFLIFILFVIFGNIFRPRRRSFFGGWGGGGFGGGGFGGGFGGGGGWGGGGGGFSGGGSSGSW